MVKYSPVPVLNALSSLWHPTQILADLLTLYEHAHLFNGTETSAETASDTAEYLTQLFSTKAKGFLKPIPELRPLKIAYVGDSTNVLHDMLVTYPRLGHTLQVSYCVNFPELSKNNLVVRSRPQTSLLTDVHQRCGREL